MQHLLVITKTIHIVSMVSWFAGLFYLPRLFVYDVESFPQNQDLHTTLRTMQRKLYRGIMTPALLLTWTTGLSLAWQTQAYLNIWFWFKISWILLLTLYHFGCETFRRSLLLNSPFFNGKQLRLLNEIPAIALISIVGTVYAKEWINWGIWISITLGSLLIIIFYIKKLK